MSSLHWLFIEDNEAALSSAVRYALAGGVDAECCQAVLVKPVKDPRSVDYVAPGIPFVRDGVQWHLVPPQSWKDCAAQIAELARDFGAHVLVSDLHLAGITDYEHLAANDKGELLQIPGVPISRLIAREVGCWYLVWRSQVVSALATNPVQVAVQQLTGGHLAVLEADRTVLITAANPDSVTEVVKFLEAEARDKLAGSDIEWHVPAFYLTRLRRSLHQLTESDMVHALRRASEDEFREWEAAELLPHNDPPSPLALWVQCRSPGAWAAWEGVKAAPQDDSEARDPYAKQIQQSLDTGLWGLRVLDLHEAVERAWRLMPGPKRPTPQFPEGVLPVDGCLTPCARCDLVTILYNAFKNAIEHGCEDGTVLLNALAHEGRLVIGVANAVPEEELTKLRERIYARKFQPRGLRHIQVAVGELNELASAGKKDEPWGARFEVFENGRRVTLRKEGDLCTPAFIGLIRPGSPSSKLAMNLPGWSEVLNAGRWAVQLVTVPLNYA